MRNLKKGKISEKQFADKYLLDANDQKKVKGGYLFQMFDQVRCEIDRYSSFGSRSESTTTSTGGNGDGDW